MCLAYQGGTGSKKPIQAYEVTTYEDFQCRSVVGDGLEGHEMWQHANLNQNGYATKRLSTSASKNNPVMALPHDVHLEVNSAQRVIDARAQLPLDNISANAEILYNHPQIPNSQVDKQLADTLLHYENVTKGKK